MPVLVCEFLRGVVRGIQLGLSKPQLYAEHV